jgi:hypothetical protein
MWVSYIKVVMNLEDLINENGLQQDKWSLTKPRFGEHDQLEVVGYSNCRITNKKFYILKCDICSQDVEIFGEGYFYGLKNNLVKLYQLPCGCSKKPNWTKEQFATLCTRKAAEQGYTFLGFIGDWKGAYTNIKMLCNKHGQWNNGDINELRNKGRGCPGCNGGIKKADAVMIASFFASGAFHPETRFSRVERLNKQGNKPYWLMSCPECGESGESFSGNLQKGQRPCICSIMRQKEAYINFVMDGGSIIAIKFGIANNSTARARQQNTWSLYEVQQHLVYQFPSVESCKTAERGCKRELECGILSKQEMPDGYTETTWAYNLEKIIEIYKRNGGIRKENP